ncbi:MAG TPA: GGDEF domain-containing protein, partial [Actinomycetota bacterium]|nr:GGDEF domain-containing protein [Actinomycetota bacterium]
MRNAWQRLSARLSIDDEKLSSLGKFAIFSAIPIVLFGMLLSYLLNGFVYQRTLEEATAQAELVANVGPVQDLTTKELHEPSNSARWQVLQHALENTPLGKMGATFNVWNTDRRIVFSSDQSALAQTSYDAHYLHDALSGDAQAFTTSRDEGGDLLSLMTPLHSADGNTTIGVLELAVPYKPVAHDIKQDFRLFYIVLLIGLNLLYAALFVVMVKSSRRLRQRAEEHEHQALHDVLTGLPNRALFRDRVKQALRVAERERQTVAIALMDLDRFKEINDTLGHHHGDMVLQETARRLQRTLRDTDTIARLGGDEFAIVLPDVADPASILLVAEKVNTALSAPF